MVERRNDITGFASKAFVLFIFIGMLGYIVYLNILSRKFVKEQKNQIELAYKTAQKRERALKDSLQIVSRDLEEVRKSYSILDKKNSELIFRLDTIKEYHNEKIDRLNSISDDSLAILWTERIRLIEDKYRR